jgi:hypothetical protein
VIGETGYCLPAALARREKTFIEARHDRVEKIYADQLEYQGT